jgi:hypothetical protein
MHTNSNILNYWIAFYIDICIVAWRLKAGLTESRRAPSAKQRHPSGIIVGSAAK